MKLSNILFTKQLSKEQIDRKHLSINSYDFISIEYLSFNKPLPLASHFIFTSKNAVDAVFSQCKLKTTQSIYAVGESTKAELLEFAQFEDIKIPDNQYNAEGLIQLFERNNSNNFLYFCGKRRLPTLENYFISNKKDYQLIEVYDTHLSPPANLDTTNYQWICFCSPSAVESYLKEYKLLPHQDILCIGNTTAKSINSFKNRIHIAKKATIDSMLNYLEKHYKN